MQYRTRLASPQELASWFANNGLHNLGIATGKVSNLAVADFDDMAAARYCIKDFEGLASKTLVVRTAKGVHVYLRPKGGLPLESKTFRRRNARQRAYLPVDIKGEGGYVVAPPSVHPDGPTYAQMGNAPGIVESDGGFLLALESRAEEWPIVEAILPTWREGLRHETVLGFAGWLRKRAGFEEDRAVAIVEGICRAADDDELADRVRAVRDTYAKLETEIAIEPFLGTDLYAELEKRKPQLKKAQATGAVAAEVPETFAPCTRANLLAAYRDHFGLTDFYIVDVELATLATSEMPGDPVWVYVLGPPSGLKTETLRALQTRAGWTRSLDHLTPHALVSGLKGAADLLPELDGLTFVIKDFTTILTMDARSMVAIFGQLRSTFDGYYEDFFGSIGKKAYESRFNLLAGVTGAIEETYLAQAILGQRFLIARTPEVDNFAGAMKATGDEERIREHVRARTWGFLETIRRDAWKDVFFVDADTRLKPLATFLALARTHVARDRYQSFDIVSLPDPELPFRIGKQLKKLCIGLALVRGKSKVGDEEIESARRIVLDSVPSVRRMILEFIGNATLFPEGVTRGNLKGVGIAERTMDRYLEDLVLLDLLKREETSESRGENLPPRAFVWYCAAPLVVEILTTQFGGGAGSNSAQSTLPDSEDSPTATNASGDLTPQNERAEP